MNTNQPSIQRPTGATRWCSSLFRGARSVALAAGLVASLAASRAHATTTYDFNDGTLQGWTVISQGGVERPNALVRVGYNNGSMLGTDDCLTTGYNTVSSDFNGDSAHAIIMVRSPLFTIDAGATTITWNTAGGHSTNTVDPGTGTGAYPANAMGVSLVESATGSRVLSSRLSQEGTAAAKSFDVSGRANDGETYYLEIVDNYDGNWGFGEWDDFSIPGTRSTLPPLAPISLTAVAGSTKVALTWASSIGATSYSVKWSTTTGGPYTEIAFTIGTSFLDPAAINGTPNYYVVSATNAYGEGPDSTPLSVTPGTQPLPSGTVVFYSFNDPGNLGRDDSGNGQNLQTTSGTPGAGTGAYGGALSLDGLSTLGMASNAIPAGVPTGGNAFTVAAFLKPMATNEKGWVGWGSDGYNNANNFRFYSSTDVNHWWFDNDYSAYSSVSLQDGAWHPVVWTYGGAATDLICYVDGIEIGRQVNPVEPHVDANGTFYVGANALNGIAKYKLDGSIDELLIANRAWTAREATAYSLGGYSVTSMPAAGYEFWATFQTPPVTGGAGHIGPDGISNLMLYALDLKLDGTNGSPGTLAGDTVTFLKRADAVTNGDVSYTIQVSDNLGATDAWHKVDATTDTATEITYLLPSGKTKTFARLVVTEGPYPGP